jgi:murein DD-endopeptidase MepM/ murein hydrolase activator NlpD
MRKSPFDFGHYLTQGMSAFHNGLDIVAVKQGTSQAWIGAPVHPILKGKVVQLWNFQGTSQGNDIGGSWIKITSGKDRVDYYGHLRQINVKVGEEVSEDYNRFSGCYRPPQWHL